MKRLISREPRRHGTGSLPMSRRRFLARLGGTALAPCFVPGSVLGANGRTPASERIRTGHIGIGGMGSGHLGGFLGNPATQVTAVCDPFQAKRETAKQRANDRYAAEIGQGAYKGPCWTDSRHAEGSKTMSTDGQSLGSRWPSRATVEKVQAGTWRC